MGYLGSQKPKTLRPPRRLRLLRLQSSFRYLPGAHIGGVGVGLNGVGVGLNGVGVGLGKIGFDVCFITISAK